MVHPLAIGLLATWILASSVSCLMTFVSPPSTIDAIPDPNGRMTTFTEGSNFNVVWTKQESKQPFSIMLLQVLDDWGETINNPEYLTQNAVNTTEYSWIVGTRKNLTRSNLFHLALFLQGDTQADSYSEVFRITTVSSPSTTPAPSSNSTTPPSTSSPTSDRASDTSSPPSDLASKALSTGTTIGIAAGLGVPLVVAIIAGFVLFFRRRYRKKEKLLEQQNLANLEQMRAENDSRRETFKSPPSSEYYFYGSNMSEAPSETPVRLSELDSGREPLRGAVGPAELGTESYEGRGA